MNSPFFTHKRKVWWYEKSFLYVDLIQLTATSTLEVEGHNEINVDPVQNIRQ
jgi:hypothetical protein